MGGFDEEKKLADYAMHHINATEFSRACNFEIIINHAMEKAGYNLYRKHQNPFDYCKIIALWS